MLGQGKIEETALDHGSTEIYNTEIFLHKMDGKAYCKLAAGCRSRSCGVGAILILIRRDLGLDLTQGVRGTRDSQMQEQRQSKTEGAHFDGLARLIEKRENQAHSSSSARGSCSLDIGLHVIRTCGILY